MEKSKSTPSLSPMLSLYYFFHSARVYISFIHIFLLLSSLPFSFAIETGSSSSAPRPSSEKADETKSKKWDHMINIFDGILTIINPQYALDGKNYFFSPQSDPYEILRILNLPLSKFETSKEIYLDQVSIKASQSLFKHTRLSCLKNDEGHSHCLRLKERGYVKKIKINLSPLYKMRGYWTPEAKSLSLVYPTRSIKLRLKPQLKSQEENQVSPFPCLGETIASTSPGLLPKTLHDLKSILRKPKKESELKFETDPQPKANKLVQFDESKNTTLYYVIDHEQPMMPTPNSLIKDPIKRKEDLYKRVIDKTPGFKEDWERFSALLQEIDLNILPHFQPATMSPEEILKVINKFQQIFFLNLHLHHKYTGKDIKSLPHISENQWKTLWKIGKMWEAATESLP